MQPNGQPQLLSVAAVNNAPSEADGVKKPLYESLPTFIVRQEIDNGRIRVSSMNI
jgi:hypothetical protein